MAGFLLKHSLRLSATRTSSWGDPGWIPRLGLTLMGPIEDGSQLVWTQLDPSGEPWFEHRVDVPALEEEVGRSFVLQPTTSDIDIATAGECAFTLRLVDELIGLDQLMHTGTFTVIEHEPQNWVAKFDWLLPLGLLAFDIAADTDAPTLAASVFLPGDADAYQIQALLFRGTELVRRTSKVSGGWTFSSSRGDTVGVERRVVFDQVRGWNNLRESGWGADFFTLDTEPGDYELRVAIDREVVRVISFTIGADGLLEAEGIEPDERARPLAWLVADQRGSRPAVELDDLVHKPAYGGDLATAALVWNSNGMYWHRKGTQAITADPGDAALATELAELGESASDMLQRWESEMGYGLDTSAAGYQQEYHLEQCQAAIEAADVWLSRCAAAGAPDSTEIDVAGEDVAVADVVARATLMKDRARASLDQASARATGAANRIDAYRAVLHADKWTIFEDRPIPDFEYLTTDKLEVTTPEDLAAAEYWYFEGVSDIEHTAQVGGSPVQVSTHGWRVLGFRFDDEHRIVDRFEETGAGSRSPVTAYQHSRRVGA